MKRVSSRRGRLVGLLGALALGGCLGNSGNTQDRHWLREPGDAGGTAGTGGDGTAGTGGDGGMSGTSGAGGTTPTIEGDPKTCEEARAQKSYIGCEFWPTVTANLVWDVFDFVAVVANAGNTTAKVEVRRGNDLVATARVAPNSLQKLYLPWVPSLKGPQTDSCGSARGLTASVFASRGAFRLTSDVPVAAYQFNALEYKGAGGPAGKDWKACPGNFTCQGLPKPLGCFSFSNDASLLLPSTALTGSYRVFGPHGLAGAGLSIGSTLTITATRPNTEVTLSTSRTSAIIGGGRVQPMGPNQQQKFQLDQAGDVAELVAGGGLDLSGSLIVASEPVQVLAGVPCANTPEGVTACDHLEESVFPAETLGQHYVVTRPSGPNQGPVQHVVKLYGHADGTTLTYGEGRPPRAPSTLKAGQVVDLGRITADFEVSGDKAFAVGMFMIGAQEIGSGDPSLTLATAVEQYRRKYVFLAPDDYEQSFVDIVMPTGATAFLDGSPVEDATPIGSSGYGVVRMTLSPSGGGAHVLHADQPVGIQVGGYGSYTSYHYPGGLDLKHIAPPPDLEH